MAKKKKNYSSDFRNMGGIIYGSAMVGSMTPILTNPHVGDGAWAGAAEGLFNVTLSSTVADVGFDAIDNIYKAGKRKRK
jgi:hypothetical protein